MPLDDMLWAGQHEPRIRPPCSSPTRGFSSPPPWMWKYLPWVERVGHRGKSPSVLKSFRFQPEDVERIRRLKASLPARSETEVVRLALLTLERLEDGSASETG